MSLVLRAKAVIVCCSPKTFTGMPLRYCRASSKALIQSMLSRSDATVLFAIFFTPLQHTGNAKKAQ